MLKKSQFLRNWNPFSVVIGGCSAILSTKNCSLKDALQLGQTRFLPRAFKNCLGFKPVVPTTWICNSSLCTHNFTQCQKKPDFWAIIAIILLTFFNVSFKIKSDNLKVMLRGGFFKGRIWKLKRMEFWVFCSCLNGMATNVGQWKSGCKSQADKKNAHVKRASKPL